jgi:hypothetical protein
MNCRRRSCSDWIRKLHANRGLWWRMRVQEWLRCFTELLKVSTNQNGGLGGSVAESAENRSLIYRFYFTPSFIHCLSSSLSIPSVLFFVPQSFVTLIIHPPICFHFCPSVTTIQIMLNLAFPDVCNQIVNCAVSTSAWYLNQLYHKHFSMIS